MILANENSHNDMFLKLSPRSSIIVVIGVGYLDMFLNFEFETSMLLKVILVVWTCS